MNNKYKVPFEIGEEVKVYLTSGTIRMIIMDVYDTPVEHVKLYELQDKQGHFHYATIEFIGKI